MFRLLWLATCHLLFATACGAADDTIPADFSPGFEKLQSLGLPALPDGTKWSVLPDSGGRHSYTESTLPRGTKGNGWLLPPDADGHLKALPAGTLTLKDIDEEKPESPGLLGRVLGGGGGKSKPASRAADLAADLKKILKEVGKKSDDADDPFDEDSYSNQRKAQQYGPLLILAAQMHQTGKNAQANELAAALFKSLPNREAILDSAVNRIADSHYQAAADAFFRTLDWKTYQDSVRSLIERFPRGWQNQSAAAILASALAQRETTGQPAVPQLKDIPLDPAALESVRWMLEEKPTGDVAPAIPPEIAAQLEGVPAEYRTEYLAELMEMSGSVSLGRSSDWLLMKPAELDAAKDAAATTRRLGIAALPVLAALADDSWFTAMPNPNASRSDYISSSAGPTERALHAYAGLNRPATRGELATILLQTSLPDPDGEIRSTEPLVLRDLALEFWQKHRDDTPEAIALAFLRDGSSEQKSKAATLLAQSTNPADQLALESHILQDPSPLSQLVTVQAIIPLRKAAAKPFLDRYVKALRAEVATVGSFEDNRDLPWEIRQMKSVEPLIKQLESQVSGQSPQARAREIAREEDPKLAATLIRGLMETLKDAPPRRSLLALLSGAVAAKNPEIRGHFLQTIFMQQAQSRETNDVSESLEPERKIPSGEAKAWKTLVTDQSEIPPSLANRGNSLGKTLGDFAAIAMDLALNPGEAERFQMACAVTGKEVDAISMPRALARLDSKPIPPLPDPSKVSSDRLAAIVATAAAKAPAEIHPYLKTLTDDERAAWLVWFRKPGDLTIPESVHKLGRTVVSRWHDHWYATDMPVTSDITLGFEINRASIQKIIDQLATDVPARSRTVVTMAEADFPPGVKIAATRFDLPEKGPENAEEDEEDVDEFSFSGFSPKQVFDSSIRAIQADGFPAEATAILEASANLGESRGGSRWAIIDGKAVLQAAQGNGEDLLPALDTSTSSSPFYFNLQILSRADAEILAESR